MDRDHRWDVLLDLSVALPDPRRRREDPAIERGHTRLLVVAVVCGSASVGSRPQCRVLRCR